MEYYFRYVEKRSVTDITFNQDELAEGQIPEPGYSGTNNEIDMDSYEFDLFGYFDDLEYGDDSYFDYGLPSSKGIASENAGQKRKRDAAVPDASQGKRRKANDTPLVGESEPLIFRSRDERYRAYKQDAPLLNSKTPFSFLPDWRERFADEDGVIAITKMPADMRKAAEAQDDDTPPKARQLGEDAYMEEGDDNGEDGWEDEDEEDDDEDGGIDIDPEMLKTILREKLGAAGLDGMDESAFMQTLEKMMSGDGDEDDAAGDLANSLLGKLTSNTGDEALSGWLSQQGVSLEDDDASSVATAEVSETAKGANATKQPQTSPPDSAVEMKKSKGESTKMPFHSGSPTASTKKRSAPKADDNPAKKHKKVQFDVPPLSDTNHAAPSEGAGPPTSDDPLMSEPTIPAKATPSTRAANAAAVEANNAASGEAAHGDGSSGKGSRKRKASAAEEKPAGKQTKKMRELQDLGPLPDAPSPAPPAKRTRSARSKAGK